MENVTLTRYIEGIEVGEGSNLMSLSLNKWQNYRDNGVINELT